MAYPLVENGYRTSDRNHDITASFANGRLNVVVLSTKNKALTGNEGEICRVTLLPGASVVNGTYSVTMKNIAMTSMDERSIQGDPTSFDITVQNDYLTLPATLKGAANTKINLPVSLTNHTGINAYQFDIVLPEGMAVATDDEGDLDITHGDRTTSARHTLTAALRADGTVRVVCFSPSNYEFSGNEGLLVNIPITIADDVADGQYEVKLTNIVLVNPESMSIKAEDVSTQFDVETTTYLAGDVNKDERIDVADASAICRMIVGTASDRFDRQAADMNADGKIDITDASLVIANVIADMNRVRARSPRREPENFDRVTNYTGAQLYIAPFAIKRGEERELEFCLHNPDQEFNGLQFKMYLPEGIKPVLDEDDELDLIPSARGKKYTYNSAVHTDAEGRDFVILTGFNATNKVWSGTDGALFTFTVKADDDMPEGTHTLDLDEIVLNYSGKGFDCPKASQTVICGDASATTSADLYGRYTDESVAELSTALAACQDITWLRLDSAYVEDLTTTFTTGNPNCLIMYAKKQKYPEGTNIVHEDVCDNLVLTDGRAFATPFEIGANVSYSRPVVANTWTGCVLPFTPEGVQMEAKVLESNEAGTLTFATASPTAGVPFAIKSETDGMATFTGEMVDVIPGLTDMLGTDFVGTLLPQTAQGWNLDGTAATVFLPFHAYLTGDNCPKTNLDDTATAITRIVSLTESDHVYTLSGQRIPTRSLKAGLYIVNGKRVVVK